MSHTHAIDKDNLIPTTARRHLDWRFLATLAGIVALGTSVMLGTPHVVEAYRGYQKAEVEADPPPSAEDVAADVKVPGPNEPEDDQGGEAAKGGTKGPDLIGILGEMTAERLAATHLTAAGRACRRSRSASATWRSSAHCGTSSSTAPLPSHSYRR